MADFVFVKSSFSGGNAGQECVEVATNVPGTVAVRDSKDPDSRILRFPAGSWAAFSAVLTAGDGSGVSGIRHR
ncbi:MULTISPECIES: DUF397 domain-containing protein [Streptomyces]|uniref:DUF397 domain-containing protein n=1 Tax=Streptomyces lycii TaxID=2654337 RepID=A0ABQ7FPN1_9ACTN|nr:MULTISPECIES: DUF397 domain-containing protein [Streptomyces]KAF4409948.1 DUF397 domain-containing protein [Streptomyces lycii]PGH50506.1 DUF397 domain-containing protein [Streptomyces sp. Ru87]